MRSSWASSTRPTGDPCCSPSRLRPISTRRSRGCAWRLAPRAGLALAVLAERFAHGRRGRVDQGHDLGVVQARGAEDADRARDAAMIRVRRAHEAELAPAELAGLAADEDRDRAGREGFVEQLDELLAL